jgi:hypothetical protein
LAAANRHLQNFEKKKFVQHDKPHSSLGYTILGENIIQELLDKNMVLLPFAIDPFGCWGPIARKILAGNGTNTIYTPNQPNTAIMFKQATTTSCPTRILCTADANWKSNST